MNGLPRISGPRISRPQRSATPTTPAAVQTDILSAAAELVAERGYHEVGMADIRADAGTHRVGDLPDTFDGSPRSWSTCSNPTSDMYDHVR